MNNCSIVKIETPKKFLLNSIILNPNKGDLIYIFVHGLGGNLFSHIELLEKIAGSNNTVLAFNNRGSGIITRVKQINKQSKKGYKSSNIGMAHEVFTDCVDDIEGAVNFAKNLGKKRIVLIGHSTGCQKSIYYLSKKASPLVEGVVLLAPMSDFADTYKFTDKNTYEKTVEYAKNEVACGRSHSLLPSHIWPQIIDAQRFLSLFTVSSSEEIFTYASGKKPCTLQRIKKPILVILAEDDEYRDRPMKEISQWFENTLNKKFNQVILIKDATHNFSGHTDDISYIIKFWLRSLTN